MNAPRHELSPEAAQDREDTYQEKYEEAWVEGFMYWVSFFHRDECASDAMRAGYDHAVELNESGGSRPLCEDADEEWIDWSEGRTLVATVGLP